MLSYESPCEMSATVIHSILLIPFDLNGDGVCQVAILFLSLDLSNLMTCWVDSSLGACTFSLELGLVPSLPLDWFAFESAFFPFSALYSDYYLLMHAYSHSVRTQEHWVSAPKGWFFRCFRNQLVVIELALSNFHRFLRRWRLHTNWFMGFSNRPWLNIVAFVLYLGTCTPKLV